jgi:hypothetical protein
MGANGVRILQKGVYERTETCQTDICVVHASLQYWGKIIIKNTAWRLL